MNAPIDPRILRLSHSSRTTLHRCPRKFQLQKIAKKEFVASSENVTLAFGTIFGIGVQSILLGKTLEQTVFEMFCAWEPQDLYAEEEFSKKSFWSAVFAIRMFQSLRDSSILAEYEVAEFNGKPANELSFAISLLDGFRYRGFVDVVLRHKVTGEFLVLEIKHTGSNYTNEATFKNSGQALGYSIVLDAIAPGNSTYQVLYLVFKTKTQEFELMPFTKQFSQRAAWIKELVMDVERIKTYEAEQWYPAYGESCNDFNRECEFLQTCHMSTRFLELPYDEETMEEKTEFTLNLNLLDLIDAQLVREG